VKNKSGFTRDRKSIRSRLVGAVLIPSISLLVLWTAASSYLVFDAVYVKAVVTGVRDVSIPAVTALASAQKERQLSMAYLGKPTIGLRELHDQELQTDQSLASMKTAADAILQNAPDEVVQRLRNLNDSLAQLPRIRSAIDIRGIDKGQVYTFYNTLLDAATSLFDTQARVLPAVTVAKGGITSASVFRATDLMSRASSLIAGGFAAGTLSNRDHLEFSILVGSYRSELDKTVPFVEPDIAAKFKVLTAGDPWKRLSDAENALIGNGAWTKGPAGLPVSESTWTQLTNQVSTELVNLTIAQADLVSSQAITDSNAQLTGVIIGSIVALIAAVTAIIVAVRVSRTLVDRTLVTRLARLRDEALHLARERLPDIVRRLREGEPVDVRSEMPELDHGHDEIGQVAEAFNAAQYTAVSAAVTEAQARDGVHNVFLGIAHRNQGLVHRQLKILDTMERGEEDPQQLELLFQLDHLATRARRNAENLIILGGEQPGRRWRKSVKLVDVLRAAVSETELYHRVQVERGPDTAVLGSAVADTIHLIAELVDNATSFSPPRSQVLVGSTPVARGVVVEVEDQGLGMSEEDRERANTMMADPPEFDAMALRADSRLGLFVVARLAARLDVTVEFRVSPYGGTRAIVLLPSQILANDVPEDPESTSQRSAPQPNEGEPRHGQVATRLAGTELDDFWSLSRSRLTDSVQTTSASAVDWPTEPPAPNGANAAERLSSGTGLSTDSLSIPWTAAAAAESESVSDTMDTERPVLPQRKPQNNLAPQLRGDVFDERGGEEADGGGRSAEEIRDKMSAFQRGSLMGRQADGPSDM
jgi:signal transduction histidine kinase